MIYRELEKAGIKNKRKAYPAEDIEITAGEFKQKNRIIEHEISKDSILSYKEKFSYNDEEIFQT